MERNRGRSPVTLLLSITVGCGVLAVIGLVWWDRPIAAWIESLPRQRAIWTEALTLLDLATLKHISNFLLGVLLLLASCLAWLIPVARRHVRPLFYLGMVQFMTTVVADLSKPIFGRLRPFEAFERTNGADTWFISANSFPSGHAAFYAGLFFPLMLIFPRWAILLMLPPLLVAASRVAEQDHYLSDVAVSLTVGAGLALTFRFLLKRPAAT